MNTEPKGKLRKELFATDLKTPEDLAEKLAGAAYPASEWRTS